MSARRLSGKKKAERMAKRSERRYRSALKGPAIAVFEQDLGLRYTWIDNTPLGFEASYVIGKTDFDLCEEKEDAAATTAIKRRVIETGVGERREVRVRYNGVSLFFDLSVEALRDEAGAIIGVTCAAVETTERRRTETALAESEALLRAVLAQIPVAIGIFDPEGNVQVVSRYSDVVYGAPNGPQGTRLRLEHPDGRAYAKEEYPSWRALNLGETVEGEPLLHRHLDGQLKHVEAYAAPVRDAHGRLIAAVTASFDVTERDRAVQLLAEARDTLEAKVADRTRALSEAAGALTAEMRRREKAQADLLHTQRLDALGQMTSGVAHDFRNVLAAAAASFSLLARRVTDEKMLEVIAGGERALDRANLLIDRLLDFGKPENMKTEVLDLVAVLPNVKDFARHSLGPGFRCDVVVDPDTWPVLADLSQFEVAILNLVVNARDAMAGGGRIELGAANCPPDRAEAAGLPPKDYVAVYVKDTGSGMPPEVVASAIEPFFTTKKRDKGTGLGLPMVDNFARRSGGALRIASEPDVGTLCRNHFAEGRGVKDRFGLECASAGRRPRRGQHPAGR